jgi:hypothetical protein
MEFVNSRYVINPTTNQVEEISTTIDGETTSIPLAVGNRHYDEIMRQVDAGTLTIADAE